MFNFFKKISKTINWTDSKNNIRWKRYDSRFERFYSRYDNVVNSWTNNEGVQRYIEFDKPIIESFKDCLVENISHEQEAFFYALVGDRVVGVMYMTSPNDAYRESYIEYLIVDPDLKGRGIGTRMICSLKSNPDFFVDGHCGTFSAMVENENIGSKRVFIKNGFKVCRPVSAQMLKSDDPFDLFKVNDVFGKWYFTERTLEDEKNKNG